MIALLSCVLVSSFFLHTIDTHHVHPGEHHNASHEQAGGEGSVYLHGNEKKLFLLTLIGFLLLGAFVGMTQIKLAYVCMRMCLSVKSLLLARCSLALKQFDYLQELLRTGILNAKVGY